MNKIPDLPADYGQIETIWGLSTERAAQVEQQLAAVRTHGAAGRHRAAYDLARSVALECPSVAASHLQAGIAAFRLGASGIALRHLRVAVRLDPWSADAHGRLGEVLWKLGRQQDALISFQQAVERAPFDISWRNNHAVALFKLGRLDASERVIRQGLQLGGTSKLLSNTLSAIEVQRERYSSAIESAEAALAFDDAFIPALNNLGSALMMIGEYGRAADAFDRILSISPQKTEVASKRLLCLAYRCDWDRLDRATADFLAAIPDDDGAALRASPWSLLSIVDDPLIHLRASQGAAAAINSGPAPLAKTSTEGRKIRLGYFSADFHNHPTTHLMKDVFKYHDRDRFEIHVFSFGPDDSDGYQQQVRGTADAFHALRGVRTDDVVRHAREVGLDIAFDINGHTLGNCLPIFARRVAPVQITWLGYPGTTGLPQMDYILADQFVIPEKDKAYYSEDVLYFPGCYQANSARATPDGPPSRRSDWGLPDGATVFGCFNQLYKIRREQFLTWMRLLRGVEGSVLWLFSSTKEAEGNVLDVARGAGIDPARVIFADRVDHARHLERYRHMDLFLDTLPCNAHTTASDALWAGIPVVTRTGRAFSGRVSTSLLSELNLTELITTSEEDYYRTALRLSQDTVFQDAIQTKLKDEKARSGLYSPAAFTASLEDILLSVV